MNMEAVAVTDHGTMSGSIEFINQPIGQGVKPIIGMKPTWQPGHVMTAIQPEQNQVPSYLLAMNETGYKSLMALSSKANLEILLQTAYRS